MLDFSRNAALKLTSLTLISQGLDTLKEVRMCWTSPEMLH